MPWNVDNRSSAYTPVSQTDATVADGHNAVELGDSPTLLGLLRAFNAADGDTDAPLRALQGEGRLRIVVPKSPNAVPSTWTRFKAALSNLPIFNRSASLRAARLEIDAVPLARHPMAETVLRNGILHAIRQELGTAAADIATSDMDAKPLTKRTVQYVLENAVHKVQQKSDAAEERRFRRSILEWTPSPQAARDLGAIVRRKAPARRAKQESSVPSLSDALRQFKAGRHEGLLQHCAVLVAHQLNGSSLSAVAQAAKDLHDRVQDDLARHGQWPIADEEYFESEIKPLAAVKLTQDA